ncbi:hypothetical protein F5Y04DRAFT_126132 [Hypomontagnella monticulosa]|nr:hypothetical protein F5Y04DRAFT_126132 [Hypomontagnella monticulosa]
MWVIFDDQSSFTDRRGDAGCRHRIPRRALTDSAYRYIVVAPNADTMDEWWRKVSETQLDYKRHSPDFFTYAKVKPHLVVPDMKNMMFTLLHDRDSRVFSTFSQQHRTDHISGKTYYIRAKGNPKVYWSQYTDGYIHASKTCRTRFRIQIDGDDKNKVMIGEDFVTVSSATDPNSRLDVESTNALCMSSRGCRIRFSDFKNNFLAEVNGTVEPFVVKIDRAGEAWELVD